MFNFPKGLYTDVRIEKISSTLIVLENYELSQRKVKTDEGVFIRVYDGRRWYYSSTTDLAAVQSEIDSLAAMASPTEDILNDPVVAKLQTNRKKLIKYGDNDISKVPVTLKLDLLKKYAQILKSFNEVHTSRAYYVDKRTVKQIISSKGTDVTFDTQSCAAAFRYVMSVDSKPYNGGYDVIKSDFSLLAGYEDAFKGQIQEDISYRRNAVPVKPGKYTCVLSPETAGIFAHESFGHKSEADFMIGDETMKKAWAIGSCVGVKELSIVDTGLEEGSGYVPFDDEGSPAQKTYLVKNGILTGRLHSAYTAAALGEECTGNARAINFEYEPIVRMTSTYIEPGVMPKEKLFEGIAEGVYIENINHGSGMTVFTIAPRRAYMIRDGKIAEPVEVAVITGNVMETLHKIEAFSSEYEFKGFALGGCGKMEQYPLAVGTGGPYIRVRDITVQ